METQDGLYGMSVEGRRSLARLVAAGKEAPRPPGMLDVIVAVSNRYQPADLRYGRGIAGSRVMQLPADLTVVLAALQEKFTAAELVEASICRQSPEGALTLSEWFLPGGLYVPLRWTPRGPVLELLGQGGCLRWPASPLEAACADYRIASCQADQPEVIIVQSIEEWDLLQRFGFIAALGGGIVELDGPGLARLLGDSELVRDVLHNPESREARPSSPIADASTRPFHLHCVLPGWNLLDVSVEVPPSAGGVVQHLAATARQFEYIISNWSVWQAAAEDLDRVRAAIGLRDPQLVAAALRESFKNNRVSISECDGRLRNVPPTPWDESARMAGAQIQATLSRLFPRGSSRLFAALQNYRRSLRSGMVDPLREQATSSAPELRMLYWQAADLAEQLIALDPLVVAAEAGLKTGQHRPDALVASQDAVQRGEVQRKLDGAIAAIHRYQKFGPVATAPPVARTWHSVPGLANQSSATLLMP